jgi:hypothetical protein
MRGGALIVYPILSTQIQRWGVVVLTLVRADSRAFKIKLRFGELAGRQTCAGRALGYRLRPGRGTVRGALFRRHALEDKKDTNV